MANILKITSVLKSDKFALMHGLQPLQNRQFGPIIKNFKNMGKTSPERQQNFSLQKATPKHLNIRKITSVPKSEKFAIVHGLQPLQNPQFGSKIKTFKNMQKTVLEPQQNCTMQKSTPKNALYSKNNKCSKGGKFCANAWTIAFAKSSIWVNMKTLKNMRKTCLEPQENCSMQKSTPKKA